MELRKLPKWVLTAGVLLHPGAPATADDDQFRGDVMMGSFFHGTAVLVLAGGGELVDCAGDPPPFLPPGVEISAVRSVYTKLEGVCDDKGPRPCAGRLTRLTENCFSDSSFYDIIPDDPETPENERVSVEYGKRMIRICFDESASGHCDEVDEVARGVTLFQLQGVPAAAFFDNDPDPMNLDISGTVLEQQRITHSKRFRLDGKRVRVKRGTESGYAVYRANGACAAANACPVAGSTLRGRRGGD